MFQLSLSVMWASYVAQQFTEMFSGGDDDDDASNVLRNRDFFDNYMRRDRENEIKVICDGRSKKLGK